MQEIARTHNAVWLLKLQTCPLEALEECRLSFQAVEEGRSVQLYRMIASLVSFVDALALSPADEGAFRAHPFWNGSRRVLKSKRLSLLAVRYVLGAARAEGSLYEQARCYAQAVEYFRQEKFDTGAILACLLQHGIYGMLDRLAAVQADADAGSDGGDRSISADEGSGESEEASGDSAPSDSSDDEGEAGGDAASNDTPVEAGSRAWWAAFLARAKEIHAGGRVPIVIAGAWSDLDDLRRRSRSRPAVLTVSQGEPADGWTTFACERVTRTRRSIGARALPARPRRLFPAPSSTCGDAEPSTAPVLPQPRT